MNAIIFMDQWMNHRGDRSGYNKLADYFASVIKVDAEIKEWDIEAMMEADIFRVFDEKMISYLQEQLISNVNQFDTYQEIWMKRRRLHWYPEYKDEYEAIEYASLLHQFAHRKDRFLPEQSAYDMFQAYNEDYYQVDMFYRKFYAAYDRIGQKDRLAALREKVEQLYTNWFLQELSVKWTNSLEQDKQKSWSIAGIEQQTDFYHSYIQPYVTSGERVFVVVSDALRYEVAKELMDTLNNERTASTDMAVMQGVIPSYTDLGMAALLPHNEIRYEGQAVFVNGVRATGTENRAAILAQYVEESLAITHQDLPKRRADLRAMLTGKKLVYIFHNTIDARGDHAATEAGVFEAAEEAINDIRLLVNQLVNDVSASNIIITTDHGFLYQRNQLEQRDKMPKGVDHSLMVKRRFIMTEEMPEIDGTLTYSMNQILEQETPLHVTMPKGTERFSIQGAGANYVHGGAMLQEIVVPVITFKNDRSSVSENTVRKVDVKLTSPVRKITNVMTYLEFFQIEKVEEKRRPLRLKLYFIDETDQRISNENIIIADSRSSEAG